MGEPTWVNQEVSADRNRVFWAVHQFFTEWKAKHAEEKEEFGPIGQLLIAVIANAVCFGMSAGLCCALGYVWEPLSIGTALLLLFIIWWGLKDERGKGLEPKVRFEVGNELEEGKLDFEELREFTDVTHWWLPASLFAFTFGGYVSGFYHYSELLTGAPLGFLESTRAAFATLLGDQLESPSMAFTALKWLTQTSLPVAGWLIYDYFRAYRTTARVVTRAAEQFEADLNDENEHWEPAKVEEVRRALWADTFTTSKLIYGNLLLLDVCLMYLSGRFQGIETVLERNQQLFEEEETAEFLAWLGYRPTETGGEDEGEDEDEPAEGESEG